MIEDRCRRVTDNNVVAPSNGYQTLCSIPDTADEGCTANLRLLRGECGLFVARKEEAKLRLGGRSGMSETGERFGRIRKVAERLTFSECDGCLLDTGEQVEAFGNSVKIASI